MWDNVAFHYISIGWFLGLLAKYNEAAMCPLCAL